MNPPTPADIEDLARRATHEMLLIERQGGSISVKIAPLDVIVLSGLLQLCLRHPGVAADPRYVQVAQGLIRGLRAGFADYPAIRTLIDRSGDPDWDTGRDDHNAAMTRGIVAAAREAGAPLKEGVD